MENLLKFKALLVLRYVCLNQGCLYSDIRNATPTWRLVWLRSCCWKWWYTRRGWGGGFTKRPLTSKINAHRLVIYLIKVPAISFYATKIGYPIKKSSRLKHEPPHLMSSEFSRYFLQREFMVSNLRKLNFQSKNFK